jgi:aspartate beta-hydroxylase
VLADGKGIEPYIPKLADRAYTETDTLGLLDDPGWSAFNLVQNGSVIEQNAARCPQTIAALKDVPLCRGDGRAPSVLFSLLRPGVRIPPHHGFTNARLICHLPLSVPPDCGALRVGNESRPWREGELMLFDDSMEHEAWNNSGELRAVLLFDVWRPELSQMERGLVSTMLASLRQVGGVASA